jgi:hypothetical protein
VSRHFFTYLELTTKNNQEQLMQSVGSKKADLDLKPRDVQVKKIEEKSTQNSTGHVVIGAIRDSPASSQSQQHIKSTSTSTPLTARCLPLPTTTRMPFSNPTTAEIPPPAPPPLRRPSNTTSSRPPSTTARPHLSLPHPR